MAELLSGLAGKAATRGSTFDSSLSEADVQEFRKEISTYKHSGDDLRFLSETLMPVLPIARLPPLLKKLLLEAFKRVEVREAHCVCTAGDPADVFYVVASGCFNLDSPEVNEGRSSLGRYKRGDFISERVLYIDSVGRTPFSVTCEETGLLFILPKSAFFAIKKHVEDGVGVAGNAAEFLTGLPVCADAKPDDVKAFAAVSKTRVRSAGEAILSPNDSQDGLMVVQTGSIIVPLPRPTANGSSSGDAPSIHLVPGDVVGEKPLADLCGGNLPASAICSYLRVPANAADGILQKLPRLSWMAENILTFKVFKSMDVFGILTAEQVEKLVRATKRVTFDKGSVVSTRGSTGPSPLWLILNGVVTVSRPNPKDTSKVDVLGQLGVGEHFGAKNIVDSTAPREVEVTADTALICLTLDITSFGDLLELVQHSLARELANRRWILENRNKVTMNELDVVRTIGVGTFGRVRLMVHAPTHKPYALKTLQKRQLVAMSQVSNVRSEQTLLSTCSHPFLLKLAAAFQDETRLYMVLEFIQGGELYKYMQDQDEGLLPLGSARFYSASIVAAFAYLNSLNIIYRDLKPENILLSSEGLVKVIDMGFAKILANGRTFTFCGTPDYMAPEIICHRGYALCCDWWSLGVFLFEMLTGLPPFEAFEDPTGIDTFGKVLEYANGRFQIDFPPDLDPAATDLIKKLCEPDVVKRFDAEQTKAHPFFSSINFMNLEKGKVTPPYVPPVKDATDASCFEEIDEDAGAHQEASDPNLIVPTGSSFFGSFVTIDEQPPAPTRVYDPTRKPPVSAHGASTAKASALNASDVKMDVKVDSVPAPSKEVPSGGGGCCLLQ